MVVSPRLKTSRWPFRRSGVFLLVVFIAWAVARPASFVALWLTPDQQGWLWFHYAEYERAARSFESPRWRGMSLYAGQDFYGAAQYFSQYQDAESLLARGNALAHAREYLDARRVYEELAKRYPDHPAPAINIPIVQALIDANRQLSESQQGEAGDLSSEQDSGPRSSEGDERTAMLEREQYSSTQLLADPELTAMWLRQVQRNPAEFLSSKFYLQLQRREGQRP
jgi:Ca-activated chloride channel family protein